MMMMIRDLQLGCLSCCPCSKAEAGRASKEPNQQVIVVMVEVVIVAMVEVVIVVMVEVFMVMVVVVIVVMVELVMVMVW